MSAATIARDETLELRLEGAAETPSFLEQYIELAERAAIEGWSHVRYLTELVTHEAEDQRRPAHHAVTAGERSCRATSRWRP